MLYGIVCFVIDMTFVRTAATVCDWLSLLRD